MLAPTALCCQHAGHTCLSPQHARPTAGDQSKSSLLNPISLLTNQVCKQSMPAVPGSTLYSQLKGERSVGWGSGGTFQPIFCNFICWWSPFTVSPTGDYEVDVISKCHHGGFRAGPRAPIHYTCYGLAIKATAKWLQERARFFTKAGPKCASQ